MPICAATLRVRNALAELLSMPSKHAMCRPGNDEVSGIEAEEQVPEMHSSLMQHVPKLALAVLRLRSSAAGNYIRLIVSH